MGLQFSTTCSIGNFLSEAFGSHKNDIDIPCRISLNQKLSSQTVCFQPSTAWSIRHLVLEAIRTRVFSFPQNRTFLATRMLDMASLGNIEEFNPKNTNMERLEQWAVFRGKWSRSRFFYVASMSIYLDFSHWPENVRLSGWSVLASILFFENLRWVDSHFKEAARPEEISYLLTKPLSHLRTSGKRQCFRLFRSTSAPRFHLQLRHPFERGLTRSLCVCFRSRATQKSCLPKM